MQTRRCANAACDSKVINPILAGIIAYTSAAMALASPFLNAAGAQMKNVASISSLNVSWTALFLLFVWVISGLFTTLEKHEHPMVCFLHACGVPGIAIAILAAIK